MNIKKVKVENFRLLRDFELDFRKNISLIVGKNNCGKTSILTIMDKLLNSGGSNFSWNDFNTDYQKVFFEKLSSYSASGDQFIANGIRMQIFIDYSLADDYANIQNFMMDLDPENNIVILEFFYSCKEDKFKQLIEDLKVLQITTFEKFSKHMEKHSSKYFELRRYSRGFDCENEKPTDEISSEIESSEIKKLINIKSIRANREASNKVNDHSLSALSQRYHNVQNSEESLDLTELQNAILEADNALSNTYNGTSKKSGIFSEIFESVQRFGAETNITIQSSISEKDLLKNNTTLYYRNGDCNLPESYNGLGYLNLIGMIFEMETIISEFHRKKDEKPSDINLLFIEEPEAHTHPQLQYIFIKNIKTLINERIEKNDRKISLQTVISTHSSHIVSECDFDDVCYLVKNNNTLISKNFEELKKEYESKTLAFKFVKQYLTLNRSELFFTDKAIFIEGDTERILLPAMMHKIDAEHKHVDKYTPLLSQNISIIEAGAHAHTFKPLIDFLGIKVLIITDVDAAIKLVSEDKNNVERTVTHSCSPVEKPTHTTNASIKYFLGLKDSDEQFSQLVSKKPNEKIIGNCRIAYQTKENDYQASSFEDAFICSNFEYVKNNAANFKQGLKKISKFKSDSINYYEIAQECIAKKSAFATEILYYDSNDDGQTWSVPCYIKEGLEWLQK